MSQNKFKESVSLVCVGSPLLDILARCGPQLLEQYHLREDDCILSEDVHTPLFHQLFNSSESRLSAGGSAQNTARIAKWVLREKGEVAFVGCTGKDDFEAWMHRKLSSEGVVPLYVPIADQSTGVCACLLSSEEKRSMCTRLGAGGLFTASHLNGEPICSALHRAQCIFVEGYFLAHSPDAVRALAQIAQTNKILFSLSLSAEYVCAKHTQDLMKVLPQVDVLFGNEAEVKTFARARGYSQNDTAEDAVQILRQLPQPPRTIVITRGSQPIIVAEGSTVHTYEVPKVPKIVDSVGCGDALSGAFLATYLLTKDLDRSIRTGIRAAAEIIQIWGCDPPTNLMLN